MNTPWHPCMKRHKRHGSRKTILIFIHSLIQSQFFMNQTDFELTLRIVYALHSLCASFAVSTYFVLPWCFLCFIFVPLLCAYLVLAVNGDKEFAEIDLSGTIEIHGNKKAFAICLNHTPRLRTVWQGLKNIMR